MDKNWFGLDPHPTDTLIHWSEKDPEAQAIVLREYYDILASDGRQTILDKLLWAARTSAILDEAEASAGAGL